MYFYIFIYIYYICSQSWSFCFTILQTTKTHSEEAFKSLPLLFFVFMSEFRLGIRVARLTVLYWLFLKSGPNLRFFALKFVLKALSYIYIPNSNGQIGLTTECTVYSKTVEVLDLLSLICLPSLMISDLQLLACPGWWTVSLWSWLLANGVLAAQTTIILTSLIKMILWQHLIGDVLCPLILHWMFCHLFYFFFLVIFTCNSHRIKAIEGMHEWPM